MNCGEFLVGLPPQNVSIGTIDTGDSRIMDARHANGKLWAVLGTAAEVAGEQRTGVGWFILNASVNSKGVSASMRHRGFSRSKEKAWPTRRLA